MGVYEGRIHQEPASVKECYLGLDRNNSEEYFNFSESDKKELASQKSTIEIYLGILNEHFWGKPQTAPTTNNSVMPLLLASMMTPPPMPTFPKFDKPTDTKTDEPK